MRASPPLSLMHLLQCLLPVGLLFLPVMQHREFLMAAHGHHLIRQRKEKRSSERCQTMRSYMVRHTSHTYPAGGQTWVCSSAMARSICCCGALSGEQSLFPPQRPNLGVFVADGKIDLLLWHSVQRTVSFLSSGSTSCTQVICSSVTRLKRNMILPLSQNVRHFTF